MTKKDAKANLNPALAVTFLIVAVTGLLMFFHAGGGGVKHLHEWMSVVFVLLSILHLCLNWKLLWAYIQDGPTVPSLIAVFLLSALLLFGSGDKNGRDDDDGHDHSHSKRMESLHRD